MPGNDGQQQDIRKYLSAPAAQSSRKQPKRRRRVMSTSDSEMERSMHSGQHQTPETQQHAVAAQESAQAATASDGEVVILETSSDSDDMRAAAGCGSELQQPCQSRGLPHQQHQRRAAGNHVPMSPTANTNNTPRARPPQRRRRRLEAVEAIESSALTDSDSSCADTDTNARSQYRDAILGVRSAQRARQQMRARTQSCPTCALFTSFLQAFL